MTTTAVVKHFDIFEQIGPRVLMRLIARGGSRSFFKLLKKLSVGALTLLCQVVRAESAKSARMSGYNSLTI